MMTSTVIDYSEEFPNAMIAQGKGNNFLALVKLDKHASDRIDGKRAHYEVLYRWLSCECERSDDEAFVCVQGSEVTYWQRKELKEGFFDRLKTGTINLFDEFNLF
jgi:hypothetical protein